MYFIEDYESNVTVIVEQMEYKIRAEILCVCGAGEGVGIDADAKMKIAVRAGFSADLLTSILNFIFMLASLYSTPLIYFSIFFSLSTHSFMYNNRSVPNISHPFLRKLIEICKPQAAVNVD